MHCGQCLRAGARVRQPAPDSACDAPLARTWLPLHRVGSGSRTAMSKLEPRQVRGGHGQGTHAALQRRSVRAQARGSLSGQEREKVVLRDRTGPTSIVRPRRAQP